MVAALAFALIAAACSSAADQAATALTPQPTIAVQPTSEPTPAAATPTAATVATPTVVDATGPSQSAADAERDGVPQVWAELSFAQRVDIRSEVEVDGERWAISGLPFDAYEKVGYEYFAEAGVDPSSGELLHIVDNQIVRSIFMPSAPPTWIVADGDLIFAGRHGDGGYPNSSIVRLDVRSGDLKMLMLPISYANHGWTGDGVWEFVAPDSLPQIWTALRAAIEAQGDVETAQVTADQVVAAAEMLDEAVGQVSTYDPTSIPRLAWYDAQCDLEGLVGGLLYDFGTSCAYQRGEFSGDASTVMVGNQAVAGRLVGAGLMGPDGKSFAAVVASYPTGSAIEPLVMINVHNPEERFDTGINGRDEGSQVQQVSFFEGGFVVTFAVDQATTVRAFNTQGQPVVSFKSPTDRDLGYPPDPSVDHAAISPDGARLAYVERDWPQDGSGTPGTSAALIVSDVVTGNELQRIAFELATNKYVQWVDFDGRWAAVSTVGYDTAEAPAPLANPFMVDIETGIVYPLQFDEHPLATFERAGPSE